MFATRILALGVGAAIAVIVTAAIALALLLAFLKFDQRLLEVMAARLALVAEDVRRQCDIGLGLGLELSELEDLGDVLHRAAAARDVAFIDVLDPRGRVMFSSAAGRLGTWVDPAGLTADASGRFRQRIRDDRLLLAVPLRHGDGQAVGEVAVQAALAAQRQQLTRVRDELLYSSLPVLAAALLVTVAAVILTVRLSDLQDREDGDEPGAERDAGAEGNGSDLDARLAAAATRAERALAALEHAPDAASRDEPR